MLGVASNELCEYVLSCAHAGWHHLSICVEVLVAAHSQLSAVIVVAMELSGVNDAL